MKRDTLTTTELAKRLGVDRRTVTRAIDRGEFPIPVLRIGKTVRFSKLQVDRYLDGHPVAS